LLITFAKKVCQNRERLRPDHDAAEFRIPVRFIHPSASDDEVSTGSGSDRVTLRQFDHHQLQARSLLLPVLTS